MCNEVAALLMTCLLLPGTAVAAPDRAAVDNGWDARVFAYRRPERLEFQETTPVFDQINIAKRPRPAADKFVPTTRPAKPLVIENMKVVHLSFRDVDGDLVTALLCTPAKGDGPFPVVVATHGIYSNKAQMAWQVGPALTARGFAVLTVDMPLHGERPGNPWELLPPRGLDPAGVVKAFANERRAIVDVRQCIDLAGELSDLDTRGGVVLAGYSMGSWVSSIVGAADDRVKAMVLMVGGALDLAPAALNVPQLAATDPRLAVPHFAGRPLLMLNGRHDHTVTPAMSDRLFDAAVEPKTRQWYDSGHLLPMKAYADAAAWVADTWKSLAADPDAKRPVKNAAG